MRTASPAAREVLADIAETTVRIRDLERERAVLVRKMRRSGASWSAIGLALGVTGAAVRQRFRDMP